MMDESISNIKIKGHAKIELFNAITGVLEKSVEKDNFIGLGGKRFLMNAALAALRAYCINGDSTKLCAWSTPDVFSRIKLTDNMAAVSEDAAFIPGNMLGYAISATYSGSDNQRGTPNVYESISNEGSLKLVFDWPTHACNGTFKTIGFDADPVRMLANYQYGFIMGKQNATYPTCCVDGLGNLFFIDDTGKLIRINLTTKIRQTVSTPTITPYSMCYYNNRIYYGVGLGASVGISYVDLATGAVTVVKASGVTSYYGLAFDGTYFYTNNGGVIYRYDTSFNLVATKTPSPQFDGSGISIANTGWLMNCFGKEININDLFGSNITNTRQNVTLPGGNSSQAPFDGTYFYQGYLYSFIPTIFSAGSGGQYGTGSSITSSSFSGIMNYTIVRLDPRPQQIGTCIVLPDPITKVNTQTMKITYTFTFPF